MKFQIIIVALAILTNWVWLLCKTYWAGLSGVDLMDPQWVRILALMTAPPVMIVVSMQIWAIIAIFKAETAKREGTALRIDVKVRNALSKSRSICLYSWLTFIIAIWASSSKLFGLMDHGLMFAIGLGVVYSLTATYAILENVLFRIDRAHSSDPS